MSPVRPIPDHTQLPVIARHLLPSMALLAAIFLPDYYPIIVHFSVARWKNGGHRLWPKGKDGSTHAPSASSPWQ